LCCSSAEPGNFDHFIRDDPGDRAGLVRYVAQEDARLVWFQGEEHAFGPQFFDAMERTTRYFRAEL
jgi:hypothetical protein